MNSREYKQIIKCTLTKLSIDETTDNIIDVFDTLRALHKKMLDELDYYSTYPRHDLKSAREFTTLIKDACKENDIRVMMFDKNTIEFKKSDYARYYYCEREITELIVFRKQDKNKETRTIDEISINEL